MTLIVAKNQPPGELGLSSTAWNRNKMLIHTIRIKTNSDNYDLWILQNSNGIIVDDAEVPAFKIVVNANGNTDISFQAPYYDEEGSQTVWLYYEDNSGGANNADITILGQRMK